MTACAIIVSYRTGDVLSMCLDALLAADGLDQVVVVDNGNAPEAEALLDATARRDPRVQLVRGQGNVGFGAACNLGARKARSDVLVFINPDVILSRDAIPALQAALADAPAPAIVGGDLRDEQGRPERGCRREELTLWRAFVSISGLSRLEGASRVFRDFNRDRDPIPAAVVPTGAISGALFAVRRADYEVLGGFDEGYFLHVEDVDICKRANDAGGRVLFAPGPHGVHVRSTSDAPALSIAKHKARGFARYFRKFARGPVHRALGELAGAALILSAPLMSRRR